MSLITVILVLLVVGILVGLVLRFGSAIGLPSPFPQIIVAVAVIAVVLWLLGPQVFGVLDMATIRVGR